LSWPSVCQTKFGLFIYLLSFGLLLQINKKKKKRKQKTNKQTNQKKQQQRKKTDSKTKQNGQGSRYSLANYSSPLIGPFA